MTATPRTRRYIIDADGTHFVPITHARRIARRFIIGIALAILIPILTAAAIGLFLGATEGFPPASLTDGTKIEMATNCWVEGTDDPEILITRCD